MESVKESQSESEPDSEEEEEEEEGGDEVEDTSRGEVPEQVEDELSGDAEDSRAAAADSILESESEAEGAEGPPRSATVSPSGQVTDKDQENSPPANAGWRRKEIKDKAAIDAYKERARQKQKYHSRRGAERIGRAKGSKSKQDNRVKLWD